MKLSNFHFLFLLFFTLSFHKAQAIPFAVVHNNIKDSIDSEYTSIRWRTNYKYNSISQPLKDNELGRPLSITKEYWKSFNSTAIAHHYKGAIVYYLNGIMWSYTITGPDWSIGPVGGPYIKVGANLSSVSSLLPHYNSNKKEGYIRTPITVNGSSTYSYLQIEFNKKTSVITKISIQEQ